MVNCKWYETPTPTLDSKDRWRPNIFIFNAKEGAIREGILMDVVSTDGLCHFQKRLSGRVGVRAYPDVMDVVSTDGLRNLIGDIVIVIFWVISGKSL